MRTVVNWISLISLILLAFTVGCIGVGIPETVNTLNGLKEGSLYGYISSYAIVSLIFWLMAKDFKLTRQTDRKKVDWNRVFTKS